jgi:hypothetical protein
MAWFFLFGVLQNIASPPPEVVLFTGLIDKIFYGICESGIHSWFKIVLANTDL